MKENMCERCPGCGRHCRRDNLHCKFGVAHFDKLEGKASSTAHKREEDFYQDDLAHRFVHAGHGIKKRMERGKISAEAFRAALNESEQVSLDEILNRLAPLFQNKQAERSY